MSVQTFNPTDLSQSAANWAVAQRIVGPFAPHAQVSPDMTIALDPGYLLNGTTLTEVKAQVVGPFAPPASGFRIDRVVVDRSTGTASIVAGTANSLTPPAIPSGKLPVARVMLDSMRDIIGNGNLVDERALCDMTPPSANMVVCRSTLGGTDQTAIPTGTYTKVMLSSTDFNIGNSFDTVNSRFMPSIAGYYEISAQVAVELPVGTYVGIALRKNGNTNVAISTSSVSVAPVLHGFAQVFDIVYLNGSMDYIELLGAQFTGSNKSFVGQTAFTYFCARRVS